MLWFHKHFFSCTLIVVLLFVVIVSYVRFMECLPEDGSRCSISYCDPSIDGEDSCDLLTEADMETAIPDAGDYTADESELDVSEEGMDEADSEMGASLEEVISEEL